MNERRIAKIAISYEFLIELMTEGHEQIRPIRVIKGIPEGAVFLHSYFDFERAIGYMVFEHTSFEPVEPGKTIPIIDVQFQTWFEPEAEEIYRKAMSDESRP